MEKIRIVADSAADMLCTEVADFMSVPMKLITDEKEFIDDAALDVDAMAQYFADYKGKSKSSCPNVSDWIEAFGDAKYVICVTITSNLSGSYNAACTAKQIYESEHEGRQVFVLDTLTAGPEMKLVVEKAQSCIKEGMPFVQICSEIREYIKTTGLLFMLKTMKNLANNGRVSPLVAGIAGLVGIHVVGRASAQGDLEPLNKCRGEKKALEAIVKRLQAECMQNGKVHIAHCNNLAAAEMLKARIAECLPMVQTVIYRCRGLCSFYAEQGGLLVGFERG
ncbi:MAG: DegV family protein [Clostridia bacterium]|nr:DegV family protein [Clostridia bacterium]